MRIAMIGHKRIPSREGGIEIVVEELATRLVESGHTVHVYNRKGKHVSGNNCSDNSNQDLKEYRGIKIITIPTLQNGKLNAVVYSFFATIRALFGKYDIIHFHAEGPCSMIWIPHSFGIKTVATIHGLDWQRAKWGGFAARFLKYGEKMAVRYADEIVVLSNNTQNYFEENYSRITKYIPNGIRKPEFKEINYIKRKFGLERDEYILFLARLVPEKGLHYLIDAFKQIETTKKLVIAGGSSHSDAYVREIKEKASQDKRIIFTGFVQGAELEELYSNAYLYVLPSDVEGMSISLLEAMSYGNCCLVSDISENIEVTEDKAVNFKKSNLHDLAEKIKWLIENPTIVQKYKQDANNYVCERYNWNDIVHKTINVYKNLKN